MTNWFYIIQDYLMPPTCILCGNNGYNSQDICKYCFLGLIKNNHRCYQCASIFTTPNPTPQLCGDCIRQPPFFDNTYAPFIYCGVLRYLITTLKFNNHYKNARLIGYLLANYLSQTAQLPEIIIPIPLHKKRLRERGFNQSTEIAKSLASHLNIPVDNQSCIRIRNTPHQTHVSAKQRHHNIKNAFALTQPIKAQHVAIIDDVMTTGATVNELAKVLKKSQVQRVDIWICARA